MLPKSDGCVAQEVGSINCQHEWLVKWSDLDYNEVTWELENDVLFQRPKALNLVKEYERRHEKARRSSFLQEVDEVLYLIAELYSDSSYLLCISICERKCLCASLFCKELLFILL